MKNPLQRGFKQLAHRFVPPTLLKHQIAFRNWRRGEIEIRHLGELVDRNRAAIDVGAYLGAYTYFLAKLTTHVFAFEPQQSGYQFLQRAYGERVTVYDCALSNYDGAVAMHTSAGSLPNQGASLAAGEKSTGNGTKLTNTVDVQVHRLDHFELNNIGFIKIDAEGEETNVLSGAESTLQRNRPTLLIEIEQRHRQGDIYDVFRDIEARGYRGEFILAGERRSLKTFSVEHHQHARLAGDKSKPYINNFIFSPT